MRATTGLSSAYSFAICGDGVGRGARAKLRLEKLETLGDLAQAVLWKHGRDVPGRAVKGGSRGRRRRSSGRRARRSRPSRNLRSAEREKISTRVASPSSWRRIDTASGKPKTRERAT
jgi:hypothetical protein